MGNATYRRDRLERQPTLFMWILPKQLISAFAQDTGALSLDSNEFCQLCEQSLIVRSKVLPAQTWSRRWKRDAWIQLLYGRTLKPSLGTSFEIEWTSSLEATRVSPLAAQDLEKEQTTQDTSGLLSQVAFKWYDPDCASSRTWKDTLALDSEKSLQTWKALVTKRRGEYSQRLKLAHLTSESVCSSWPTVTANEDSYRIGGNSQQSKCLSAMARRGEMSGPAARANHSTHGSRPESWQTPDVGSAAGGRSSRGQSAPEKASLEKQAKAWATPRAGKTTDENPETWALRHAKGNVATMPLTAQVKSWATPWAEHDSGGHRGTKDTLHSQMKQASSGKLNPRWVCTLMNLPVFWVKP